ncbi:MAG TPA: ImmA/IrrE family metallo-endopeptidase, partial [Enhygromyxa sp.]|nr:ImmA/IrrE family metallo-endopeptidase [Enhygromyxa sp.]
LLGDFLACVADTHELERALGLPEPVPLTIDAPDQKLPDWEQGRECARRVRDQLDLGDEPILSMHELLEQRLRWSLFFVTPDDLSAAVDGASTSAPKPAILINLVGGRETWWRTRMSLAHEMCHVLVDARILAQPYLLSPHGGLQARNRWALVERFRSIEARANAFAAYLLVPGPGLRKVVGRVSQDSDETINRVCRTFGVGRKVAVNRLHHEYGLSDSIVERMIARGGSVHHEADHPDAAIIPGLRTERLRRLVTEALDAELIDGLEARSILNIPTTEPITAIMGARVHAPLLRSENLARARAEAHVWESKRAPCVTTGVTRTADGWSIEVDVHSVDGVSRQVVRLSPDFEPIIGSERT